MGIRSIRRALAFLENTPMHPQWFALRGLADSRRLIAGEARGVTLDVGCGRQVVRQAVEGVGARYVGLDYLETAREWYGTRPDVYGDAHELPVASAAVDRVLLLDVLEHLADPGRCLREIHRVLKPRGRLVIEVPFLYPIHDAPRDFQRWTVFGLAELAQRHDFIVRHAAHIGHPLETACLLFNIALCNTAISWVRQRRPAALLGLLVPPLVLMFNVLAWLLAKLSVADDMMPSGYRLILEKP